MKKIAFFLGKGGVGKTTISSAVAYQFAKEGKRVLIVSLDPAHNLGDVFQKSLANTPRSLDANLEGMEIDLAVWVEKYLKESREEIKANYMYQSAFSVDAYIDILKYSPGTEEYAVLWAIEYVYKEYGGRCDLIIFDTPPTALTLRFLAMPSITRLWVRELSRLREKILQKRQTILRINPKASIVRNLSEETEDAQDEPKVRGAAKKEDDLIYTKLSSIASRLAELQRLFSHESYLAVVVNPDTLSVAEALRIRQELGKLDVRLNSICLNKTTEGGEGRQNVEKNFGDCPVFATGLRQGGIGEVSQLAEIQAGGLKNDMKRFGQE
ncbi:MAG: ArsA family ATPase [Spirochaetales bacterium]|jgi:arsenite-transporting ATPase|nr:ArsA family ATPase [Spirochaetales bacterium]